MTTNTEIITSALREVNIINETQSPSAEQTTTCLEKLNDLMESWKEDDIRVGWFKQTSGDDDAPLPDWLERATKLGLAIRCAGQYGASISPTTAADFDDAWTTVLRKVVREKMDNADMTHMPFGDGRTRARYDIQNDS